MPGLVADRALSMCAVLPEFMGPVMRVVGITALIAGKQRRVKGDGIVI
jgi:hypothetical protein